MTQFSNLNSEAWAKYCFPNESWASPEFQRRLFTQHKMLCSKHFIKTCFVEQKLFRTAVPSEEFDEGDSDTPAEEHSSQMSPDTPAEEHSSQMSPDIPAEEASSEIVPDPPEELKVCRICLALDVKMYNMEDWKLTEMFQNITGIQVSSDSPSILQRLCWECAARLTAAAAFRDKALLSDGLLQILLQAGDDVTKSDIISMKENHTSLKTALTIQKVFYTADEKENEQDTSTDNLEIDNTLLNNEIKTYSRIINVARDNRTHCPTFIREVREEGAGVTDKIDTEMLGKHLIVIPTNIDSDPMDDITNKNRACPLLEFVNFVKNPIVVNEVEVDSTEATPTDNTIRSDTNKEINETTRVAVINEDGNIVLIDKKVKKHKIDEIYDTVSCEDDTLQPKAKKFLIKTVDIKPMKVKPGIKRKNKRRCTTAKQDRSMVDRVREEQTLHTPSLAKEFGVSPSILRARLRDAGFKPLYVTVKKTPRILKKKQKVNTRQRIDEGTKQIDEGTKQVDEGTKKIDEGTKQQVMSSEQDGESVSEIARRLDTSSR